jgi:hypothetical protein
MALAVICWSLTVEAWVLSEIISYEFYGGQSGFGTGFCLHIFVFPCQ